MGSPPGYRPSGWVHLLHQVPHTNFQFQLVSSGFAPQESDYQQALLLVAALAGLGLALSLLLISLYLIRFCCCHPEEPPEDKGPRGGCITWSCVTALLVGCAGIGIGFYGNSETSDGVSQLSYSLLHANHTLSSIDRLVADTVERLGAAVRNELTTLEEVLAPQTELVARVRGTRRQVEGVAQQLGEVAFWRGVPLSPLRVAEHVSFVEEYRWLAYVLLLLLDLLVCLFTLLGLAKQSKWLVIVMTVMSLLVLVLSWGSMGLEAAAAVGLSDFCSSPDPFVLNLTQAETGLSTEADPVPASSGQHPLPVAGAGAGGRAPVPRLPEAAVDAAGDPQRDGGKLPPVGGVAALPRPAQVTTTKTLKMMIPSTLRNRNVLSSGSHPFETLPHGNLMSSLPCLLFYPSLQAA
ncbi:protein tweety homolog 1 isoform X4 [Ornithorhynchus anatinus]|uniref:protein tweety homolog 1 isoform X4 n=1 Tax=Ornithorhynchus anatinus TaxID=9258 RepID=UPI0010A85BC7|nr:protein tweety homolog 1 isoform X4 [Ornithorhynchus anatinus]